MTYFVPNFLLIIFLKTKKIYLVPPTQKIAKTVENSAKIAPGLGSNFSRLGPKSKKPYAQFFHLFLVILKRLSARFYLLWVFQKSAHCETQYFDINVRGRGSNFFSPNFLDVFLDVESDKKNRLKFWPSGAEISPFFWFWSARSLHTLSFFQKIEKFFFQKSMKYGLFCSKFSTDHFYEVHFGQIWSHLRKK